MKSQIDLRTLKRGFLRMYFSERSEHFLYKTLAASEKTKVSFNKHQNTQTHTYHILFSVSFRSCKNFLRYLQFLVLQSRYVASLLSLPNVLLNFCLTVKVSLTCTNWHAFFANLSLTVYYERTKKPIKISCRQVPSKLQNKF